MIRIGYFRFHEAIRQTRTEDTSTAHVPLVKAKGLSYAVAVLGHEVVIRRERHAALAIPVHEYHRLVAGGDAARRTYCVRLQTVQAHQHLRMHVSGPELAWARAAAHAHVQLLRRYHPVRPTQVLERYAQALQVAAASFSERASIPSARLRAATLPAGAWQPV